MPKKLANTKHNKNFPIVKTTRTKMLKTLAESGGKFVTTTHIGKDQKPHTINGIRYKKQDDPMGYVKVYSMTAREMRLVNPQTLTDLSFQGMHYVAKR
jgi:hypothetical protein